MSVAEGFNADNINSFFYDKELLLILISIAGGMFGVIIGSIISHYNSSRLVEKQGKQQNTISLFQDFHSDQMTEWRIMAWNCLSSREGESFSSSFSNYKKNGQKGLSIFFHYLEKISSLDEAGLIDESLLRKMLGIYFKFWFVEVIDKMAPEPADSEWVTMLTRINRLRRFSDVSN